MIIEDAAQQVDQDLVRPTRITMVNPIEYSHSTGTDPVSCDGRDLEGTEYGHVMIDHIETGHLHERHLLLAGDPVSGGELGLKTVVSKNLVDSLSGARYENNPDTALMKKGNILEKQREKSEPSQGVIDLDDEGFIGELRGVSENLADQLDLFREFWHKVIVIFTGTLVNISKERLK